MPDPRDHLLSWLRDAHAAEEQAITMLSSMARRLENYPELRERVETHVHETERQAERIEECLERMGSDTSALKVAGTKTIGLGQALSGIFTSDEVMKGVLASYTFEQMEIASYRILINAARRLGEEEVERVCREILDEEIAMATWLEDHMAGITDRFLERAADEEVTEKH